jgi:hypothetical protein
MKKKKKRMNEKYLPLEENRRKESIDHVGGRNRNT